MGDRARVERERLQTSAKIRSAQRVAKRGVQYMPPDEAASAADEDWDDDRGGDALMSAER